MHNHKNDRHRRHKHGHLRGLVLSMFNDGSELSGYDIISRLGEDSGGFFKPSPGSIYPVLAKMHERGILTVRNEDGKKLYRLTEQGKEHQANRRKAKPRYGEAAVELKRPFHEIHMFSKDIIAEGDDEKVKQAITVLEDCSSELRKIRG